MINILAREQKTEPTEKPHYRLTYYYTIGDSNGNTEKTVQLSLDNPYIERYVKLI